MLITRYTRIYEIKTELRGLVHLQFGNIPDFPYHSVIITSKSRLWKKAYLSCYLSLKSQFPLTPTLKKKNQKNRIPPLIRALLRFYSDKRILSSEGNAFFLRRKARTRPEKKVVTYVRVGRYVRTCWRASPFVKGDANVYDPEIGFWSLYLTFYKILRTLKYE